MNKSKKLQKMERNAEIVQMSLSGIHPNDIAEHFKIERNAVDRVITEAYESAKESFTGASQSLLVTNYMRLDTLINRMMQRVEDKDGDLSLYMVDRINNLIKTQASLIAQTQPKHIKVSGDRDNPLYIAPVFSTVDPIFHEVFEMAKDDRLLLDLPKAGAELFEEVQEKVGIEIER